MVTSGVTNPKFIINRNYFKIYSRIYPKWLCGFLFLLALDALSPKTKSCPNLNLEIFYASIWHCTIHFKQGCIYYMEIIIFFPHQPYNEFPNKYSDVRNNNSSILHCISICKFCLFSFSSSESRTLWSVIYKINHFHSYHNLNCMVPSYKNVRIEFKIPDFRTCIPAIQ